MRVNNRNSIARIIKFPRFTTMNVIDGQAGLIICASLFFYSLTIDNILNIIVLLILVAVTISTLTGENGILAQAGNAKTKTEQAQIEEEIKLAYNSVQTDSYINGWDINKKAEELQKELQKKDASAVVTVDGTKLDIAYKKYETKINENGTLGENEISVITINEFSINGTVVETVPEVEGFVHVGGTIEEGYVISDDESDEGKGVNAELVGNQFVWVPVEKDQKITIKVSSEEEIASIVLTDPYGDIKLNETNVGTSYSNTEIIPTINGKYKVVITTASGTKEEELDVFSLYAIRMWEIDMYTSDEYAKLNGYEDALDFSNNGLGKDSIEDVEEMIITMYKNGTIADTEDYKTKVNTNGGFFIGRYEVGKLDDGTMVTQKKQTVYNDISQIDALEKAQNYKTSATSSLLTGAAGDRILGWLYETENKRFEEITIDSSSWGNYSNDTFSNTTGLINTGEFENTMENNIYDICKLYNKTEQNCSVFSVHGKR